MIRSDSGVSDSFFLQNARVARLIKISPLNGIAYLRLSVLIASSRKTVAMADDFCHIHTNTTQRNVEHNAHYCIKREVFYPDHYN